MRPRCRWVVGSLGDGCDVVSCRLKQLEVKPIKPCRSRVEPAVSMFVEGDLIGTSARLLVALSNRPAISPKEYSVLSRLKS